MGAITMAFRSLQLRPSMSPSAWNATALLAAASPSRTFTASAAALKKKTRARVLPTGGSSSSGGSGSKGTVKRTPSVSGQQIVAAVEGRRARRGGFKKKGAMVAGQKAFPEGTDPFRNKFDDALGASKAQWRESQRGGSRTEEASNEIPEIEGKHLIGSAQWETVMAKEINIKNVTPKNRPKVAQLEHGLDRVLFNPGVHWLQDPRSSVYNFNPYLKSICQPEDFDYGALPAYMRASQDPQLDEMTRRHKAKYMGSTSSMTSILSQFYFLIAAWKPMKMSHLSEVFAYQPRGFTRLTRAPVTSLLIHKGDGRYAIDADKTFDSTTILMELGKSMEKMLTSTPEEFARYRKENSHQITEEERNTPEAFNYITADNNTYLLRSQLDCEDERLPGRTFDLKTRAAVAIRLDVHNYEQHSGYQLRKSHGFLESFEREYYDMMRSAFLKYSLQVRIGQMDGIFVAFHNTAKIFGFQYISLEEMDSRLFGSSVMGNECFKNQLRLLSRTLDAITSKYPKQDVRITVDTHEMEQRMNVWVETLPLGHNAPVTFDADGVPEMQPGAELSLWQIVCFSTINGIDTVGPFELSDSGRDEWILNYKIAQLKRPDMLKEFHRMKTVQSEIYRANEKEEEAAVAAAAESTDPETTKAKTRPTSPPAINPLLATITRISERGRRREEKEGRMQGDKEVIVWEPKGYVRLEDLASTKQQNEFAKDETEVTASSPMTLHSSTTDASSSEEETLGDTANATLSSPRESAPGSLETLRSKMREKLAELRTDEYTVTESGDQVTLGLPQGPITLNKDEHALLAKGQSQKLSLQELTTLAAIHRKYHPALSNAFGYVDDTKTKLRLLPYNPEREQLTRSSMETILKALDEPTEGTDDEIKARVMDKAVLGRARLILEYFHRRMHLVAAGRGDGEKAEPISALDIASGKVPQYKLVKMLYGMDAHPAAQEQVRKQDPSLTQEEAAALVLLSNVFYAERRFSEDQLKEMGFPKIFRSRHLTIGRPLLNPSSFCEGVGKGISETPQSKSSRGSYKERRAPPPASATAATSSGSSSSNSSQDEEKK